MEPSLPREKPLVLLDYPALIPTTARRKTGTPWAERWELYIDGVEIANCYTEETDLPALQELFRDESTRKAGCRIAHPPDADLPGIVASGPAVVSGAALGLDRLAAGLPRRGRSRGGDSFSLFRYYPASFGPLSEGRRTERNPMIKASDITKGTFVLINNQPHVCVEREYVNPGKGSAFVRLKLKNIKSGSVLRQTNKVQDNLEEVSVEYRDVQFLYADDENYHFMDTRTYEQFTIAVEGEEEKRDFLKDGETYQVVFWEAQAVDIKLPTKMVFTVTEAEKAEKGDTVSGATKTITCETGLKVRVPLFIKQGDRILVNTETREYQERVND